MKKLLALQLALTAALTAQAQVRVPVILELFTSEGCSSCPPADNLLAELEKTQPLPHVDIIVLSEHVDYWDSLGWKDPFSDKLFSVRQQTYAHLSDTGDIYTPEAVIDGDYATVGSNRQNLLKAIAKAANQPKPDLTLELKQDKGDLSVEVPAMPTKGVLWIAITQSSAISHVEHGENSGRTLHHVGVVRYLTKATGTSTHINLASDWPRELHVVAFIQNKESGRILQATQKSLQLN